MHRTSIFHLATTLALLYTTGCSYYTLQPATATESGAILEPGNYVVVSTKAMLVQGWSRTGVGVPNEELSEVAIPEIGKKKIADIPQGTSLRVDRYVRLRQHGLYDCGYDKAKMAIGMITDGPLRGREFSVESIELMDTHLVQPAKK